MNWRIHRFPILPSTNDLALEWMRSGQATAGDVLVADEQLAGRGRPGRAWHSGHGALLFTAVLPFWPERVGWTALAAGVAVASAVRELGAPAGVKWPNDVVLRRRKLAGILVETSTPGLAAVGVGMNVSNPLPEEVRERAVRLDDSVPDVTPESVLDAVLGQMAAAWDRLSVNDLAALRERWEALDTTVGRGVRWSEAGIVGTADGIEDSGALRIRTDDGRVLVAAVGEVGFLDPQG